MDGDETRLHRGFPEGCRGGGRASTTEARLQCVVGQSITRKIPPDSTVSTAPTVTGSNILERQGFRGMKTGRKGLQPFDRLPIMRNDGLSWPSSRQQSLSGAWTSSVQE